MTADQKEQAIEYLRSCALEAHQTITALRANNYGEALDLIEDAKRDLAEAELLLPENAPL